MNLKDKRYYMMSMLVIRHMHNRDGNANLCMHACLDQCVVSVGSSSGQYYRNCYSVLLQVTCWQANKKKSRGSLPFTLQYKPHYIYTCFHHRGIGHSVCVLNLLVTI